MVPIDTAKNILRTLFNEVTSNFQDLVISQDPAPVVTFKATVQAAGAPILFDASASLSPIFKDPNRIKNTVYTYYVVAVSGSGIRSIPVIIVVDPKD